MGWFAKPLYPSKGTEGSNPSLSANIKVDRMKFEIDPEFIKDVPVITEYHRAKDPSNPTPEELIAIIKDGPLRGTSHTTKDHPEYAKLRDRLEELGYIKIERMWWNGDRVLKRFTLNGVPFKKDDQFSCAGAMRHHLEYRSKRKENDRKQRSSLNSKTDRPA